MYVGCVVEAVLEDFLVGVDKSRFLLELALQILECMVEFLVEHEEAHAEGEHVLAPYDGLHVQTTVLEALLCQGGYRRHDDVPVTYAQLLNGIHGLESGLLNALLVEGILIQDNCSRRLGPFGVGHKCRGIHGDKYVAEISRGIDLNRTYVYLKTGHT